MNANITPEPKKKSHSSFAKALYNITSATVSFLFVLVVFCSAVLHHIRALFKDNKHLNEKQTIHECYPDIENMKLSSDIRYYALQMGLDLQEYKITTKDGYILILHRLIDPKHSEEQREQMKPVLFQHGLLSSSGSFISPGLRSMPVFLLNEGFDVWLGNNRSGFEPLHEFYKGNLMHNETYWDWDIKDLAYYDMPCLIENVLLRKSQYQKLILIAHLQGCTQSFLMLRNPELSETHNKIEHLVSLAPAIYPGRMFHQRKFLSFMANRSQFAFQVFFGVCCFLHSLTTLRNILYAWPIYGKVCMIMFHYLFQWPTDKWNQNNKVCHIHFIFNVSLVSAKNMTWWLSYWRNDSFRNELTLSDTFEKGLNDKIIEDEEFNVKDESSFFPYKQQWFDKNVVPMTIFTGSIDDLVDGARLKTHMENFEPLYKIGETLNIIAVKDYSHLDILWADDIIEEVGKPLMKFVVDQV